VRRHRREPSATADRGHDEVERGVSRVTALDAQILWSLMFEPNLDQLLSLLRVLTEVRAETTLSILNLSQNGHPFVLSESQSYAG
jgi:hypothetical protein